MWNWRKGQRKACEVALGRAQEAMNAWAGTAMEELLAVVDTELADHLRVCEDCRSWVEEQVALRDMLRQGIEPAGDPGEAYTKRILAAAQAAGQISPVSSPWMALPAVAARMAWVCALVLLLTAVWLRQTRAYAPPPPSVAIGETALVGDSPTDSEDVLISAARSEQ